MGLPRAVEAQRFYRAAKQRFDDSQLLLEMDRTTGAVYLAGYTVEGMLKALILESVSRPLRRELFVAFRGNRAHDMEWLGVVYRQRTGRTIPREVVPHLTRVAPWSTDLRYATGHTQHRDAELFFESLIAIDKWADKGL
jgi:HEPN domain-containing protein